MSPCSCLSFSRLSIPNQWVQTAALIDHSLLIQSQFPIQFLFIHWGWIMSSAISSFRMTTTGSICKFIFPESRWHLLTKASFYSPWLVSNGALIGIVPGLYLPGNCSISSSLQLFPAINTDNSQCILNFIANRLSYPVLNGFHLYR